MPRPSVKEFLTTVLVIVAIGLIITVTMRSGVRGFIEYILTIASVLTLVYLIEHFRKQRKNRKR